jgi:hypothetical protein
MARSNEEYTINIHYPETDYDMIELRKRMGIVYDNFIKQYILTLPICNEEKNKIYASINEKLVNNAP